MTDLTHALRHLRQAPAFTAIAVLSIALGIGANTAVFTLVDAFLLRPLPVRNPGELVLFRAVHGAQGPMSRRGEGPGFIDAATGRSTGTPFSLLAFERFRGQRSTLTDVFAFSPFSEVNVLIDGVPESTMSAQYVSGGYYAGLGIGARLGRVITAADDDPGAPPVAVISDRFWANRFARDPAVIGRTIQINRVPVTIVGVTPAGFNGAMQAGETADVSVALAHHLVLQPNRAERAQPWYWWVRIMGRLAPGATRAQAQASLEPLFREAAREGWAAAQVRQPAGTLPDDPTLIADPGDQGENDIRRQYARSLQVLMGLVGLVLLAACANVANLLTMPGHARRREIALRLALGATRRRIVSQLIVESGLLAAAGGTAGVLLAWWGRDLLLALRPFGNTEIVLDLRLDGRVLAFNLLSTLATALVFGLLPALRSTRVDLTAALQGSRTLGPAGRARLSQAFTVIQVALSIVLLISTGLFVRTVSHLEGSDAGFNTRNLVLFRIDAVSAGYTANQAFDLHDRLQQRLEQMPGVRGVTFSRVALLSRTRQNMTFALPGRAFERGAPTSVNTNGVAPNFFTTMELPLVLGRGFTARDHAAAPPVAVVNQAFVRAYLGGDPAIGRHIDFGAPNFRRRVEIVGVAADARYTVMRGAVPPTVYLSALQQPDGNANFAVRAGGDLPAVMAAVRTAVRAIDPTLPVLNLRTQAEQIERLHGQERLFARLSGFFGITALGLASIGLYGLMSQLVSRRTGEIGLRLALGARPAQIRAMVLREALTLVCAGAAIGVAAAAGAVRLVASLLSGISPTDPSTYAAVVLVLTATAWVASMVPARRASRIEPLSALRGD